MILCHLRCTPRVTASSSTKKVSALISHSTIHRQNQSHLRSSHPNHVHILQYPQHRSLTTRPKQKMGSNHQGDRHPRNKSKPGWKNSTRGSKMKQKQKGNNGPVVGTTTIRPPKNYLKRLPKATKEPILPPAMLVPTASPYVYIAQTALGSNYGMEGHQEGNNNNNSTVINPSTLFAEAVNIVSDDTTGSITTTRTNLLPPLFSKGDFVYFSPKHDLGHNYPSHGVPEVAFLGRSNVGKSSLINALMRKNLCITSKSPGRTQLPYYYGLIPKSENLQQEQKRAGAGGGGGGSSKVEKTTTTTIRHNPSTVLGYIIDLPGYGYGKAPKAIVEDWRKDTQDLLLHRRRTAGVLQRLFLLLDARRGGPNELDRTVMRWLEDADIPYTVVLTKADRISVPLVVRQVNDFCLRYASLSFDTSRGSDDDDDEEDGAGGVLPVAQSPVIHVTSSTKGWGIHELMLSVEAEFVGDEGDDDTNVGDFNHINNNNNVEGVGPT